MPAARKPKAAPKAKPKAKAEPKTEQDVRDAAAESFGGSLTRQRRVARQRARR